MGAISRLSTFFSHPAVQSALKACNNGKPMDAESAVLRAYRTAVSGYKRASRVSSGGVSGSYAANGAAEDAAGAQSPSVRGLFDRPNTGTVDTFLEAVLHGAPRGAQPLAFVVAAPPAACTAALHRALGKVGRVAAVVPLDALNTQQLRQPLAAEHLVHSSLHSHERCVLIDAGAHWLPLAQRARQGVLRDRLLGIVEECPQGQAHYATSATAQTLQVPVRSLPTRAAQPHEQSARHMRAALDLVSAAADGEVTALCAHVDQEISHKAARILPAPKMGSWHSTRLSNSGR